MVKTTHVDLMGEDKSQERKRELRDNHILLVIVKGIEVEERGAERRHTEHRMRVVCTGNAEEDEQRSRQQSDQRYWGPGNSGARCEDMDQQ